MLEKRQFQRLQHSSKTILSHHDAIYQGQLENISMNGALVRLEHGTFLPQCNGYDLKVFIDGENTPFQLNAEVVCVTFAMAGIKFTSYKADTKTRLERLLEKLSLEPDTARTERERIRRRLADDFREE